MSRTGECYEKLELSAEECAVIARVIQKDIELRIYERQRLVNQENMLLHIERRAAPLAISEFNERFCIHCYSRFFFIFNQMYSCHVCHRNYCRSCGSFVKNLGIYLCFQCQQEAALIAKRCPWFYQNCEKNSLSNASILIAKLISTNFKSHSQFYSSLLSLLGSSNDNESSDYRGIDSSLEHARIEQKDKLKIGLQVFVKEFDEWLSKVSSTEPSSSFALSMSKDPFVLSILPNIEVTLKAFSQALLQTVERKNALSSDSRNYLQKEVIKITRQEIENIISTTLNIDFTLSKDEPGQLQENNYSEPYDITKTHQNMAFEILDKLVLLTRSNNIDSSFSPQIDHFDHKVDNYNLDSIQSCESSKDLTNNSSGTQSKNISTRNSDATSITEEIIKIPSIEVKQNKELANEAAYQSQSISINPQLIDYRNEIDFATSTLNHIDPNSSRKSFGFSETDTPHSSSTGPNLTFSPSLVSPTLSEFENMLETNQSSLTPSTLLNDSFTNALTRNSVHLTNNSKKLSQQHDSHAPSINCEERKVLSMPANSVDEHSVPLESNQNFTSSIRSKNLTRVQEIAAKLNGNVNSHDLKTITASSIDSGTTFTPINGCRTNSNHSTNSISGCSEIDNTIVEINAQTTEAINDLTRSSDEAVMRYLSFSRNINSSSLPTLSNNSEKMRSFSCSQHHLIMLEKEKEEIEQLEQSILLSTLHTSQLSERVSQLTERVQQQQFPGNNDQDDDEVFNMLESAVQQICFQVDQNEQRVFEEEKRSFGTIREYFEQASNNSSDSNNSTFVRQCSLTNRSGLSFKNNSFNFTQSSNYKKKISSTNSPLSANLANVESE